jgi:hypothetical protein
VISFSGLASFYRSFVPKFAEIAKTLTQLIRKDVQFKWDSSQQAAFEKLKETLCTEQVLAYPDFNSVYPDDGRIQGGRSHDLVTGPRGSRAPNRICKSANEQSRAKLLCFRTEMLAVIWATKQFRCYLFGKRFTVRTDHSALNYLHKFAGNNSRLMRWSLRLAELGFDIEHRPGTQIKHADALSRHVQTVTANRPLSKELVKAEQGTDKFCNTLRVGKPKEVHSIFITKESYTGGERTENTSW